MSPHRVLTLCTVLLGCASTNTGTNNGATAATHPENPGGHAAHEGGEHHHHRALPAEVDAYHDVLAPLWHAEAGDARNARTCEQADTLRTRAGAVTAMGVPEAARARETAWRDAATRLGATSEALATACGATPRGDVPAALEAAHTAFHGLLEALHGEHR